MNSYTLTHSEQQQIDSMIAAQQVPVTETEKEIWKRRAERMQA